MIMITIQFVRHLPLLTHADVLRSGYRQQGHPQEPGEPSKMEGYREREGETVGGRQRERDGGRTDGGRETDEKTEEGRQRSRRKGERDGG
jgi:hypothetical protein